MKFNIRNIFIMWYLKIFFAIVFQYHLSINIPNVVLSTLTTLTQAWRHY